MKQWLFFLNLFSFIIIGGPAMAFSISSPVFVEGTNIPLQNTCDGPDLSPPLKWAEAPAGTKSFALIMEDPDAPAGTWVHWAIYDIPGNVGSLEEGLEKKETIKNGAKHGLAWGVNDFSRLGYYGPCPPPGKPHRYIFKLYALDRLLNLPPKVSKPDLEKAMKGAILGQTQLMGKYGR